VFAKGEQLMLSKLMLYLPLFYLSYVIHTHLTTMYLGVISGNLSFIFDHVRRTITDTPRVLQVIKVIIKNVNCVVCSSVYGFWLLLWYIQNLLKVGSVLPIFSLFWVVLCICALLVSVLCLVSLVLLVSLDCPIIHCLFGFL
jgi:hypothetical protein